MQLLQPRCAGRTGLGLLPHILPLTPTFRKCADGTYCNMLLWPLQRLDSLGSLCCSVHFQALHRQLPKWLTLGLVEFILRWCKHVNVEMYWWQLWWSLNSGQCTLPNRGDQAHCYWGGLTEHRQLLFLKKKIFILFSFVFETGSGVARQPQNHHVTEDDLELDLSHLLNARIMDVWHLIWFRIEPKQGFAFTGQRSRPLSHSGRSQNAFQARATWVSSGHEIEFVNLILVLLWEFGLV